MTTKKNTQHTTLSQLAEALSTSDPNTYRRFVEQHEQGVINPIVLAKVMGIRPQMVYNYISKGKFSTVDDEGNLVAAHAKQNSTQKKVLDFDEANTWATSYFERKVERETKAAEKLAAELAGETELVEA